MFGRLTVYDFPAPPEAVLDLGCGTGLWCVEAAKQWPVCVLLRIQLLASGINMSYDIPIQRATFVGVDIKKIQPDLFLTGHTDLSSRIKWVHVNLYAALALLASSACTHSFRQLKRPTVRLRRFRLRPDPVHRPRCPGR